MNQGMAVSIRKEGLAETRGYGSLIVNIKRTLVQKNFSLSMNLFNISPKLHRKNGFYCHNVRENMQECLPYVFVCVLLNQQATSN